MVVKGYIESFVYVNTGNYYGVFNLVTQDFEEPEIRCTGCVRGMDVGDFVELTGEMGEHPNYGPQFNFKSFKNIPPDGLVAIERYLASGAIKGIGAALALRITKKFGEDTLRIMEEEPERLVEVRGISERIAREIAEQVIEKKDVRNAMMFLQKYGISNNMAVKIYEFYGEEIYHVLEDNPYQVANDIQGIGFKTMDDIALKNGIAINSEARICGGVLYCLQLASLEGHTYLPKEILYQKTATLLGVEQNQVEIQVENLHTSNQGIICRDDKVFLRYMFFEELNSAIRLRALVESGTDLLCTEAAKDKIIQEINAVSLRFDLHLDEVQKNAVVQSAVNGVFILTGGPGTGKTTTLKTIIRYFYENNKNVLLAAPTGRAAKRMEETTGFMAKTIHRLLEVNGGIDGERGRFQRNAENPLEADVVIIDEMSMVDIHLFAALLDAIPNGAKLILSGDANQLPSVGAGNVLKDLLQSGYFPSTVLEQIYRQSEGSDIASFASMINKGEIPVMDNKSNDFFFLQRDEKMRIYRDCVVMVRDQLPKNFRTTSKNIQVLTPMKKGNYGVEMLNKLFQEQLNPASDKKPEINRGEHVFRVGDKVMQIKNNYDMEWVIRGFNGIVADSDKGVFNGDTGVIQSIDKNAQKVVVLFDDNKEVEYSFGQLEELELAYAITIHKSQGSEYPAVIMPIVDGPEMLFNRNLLYTGITRASKCVIIIGERSQVEKMIRNEGEMRRYTDFLTRLSEKMEHR